jgi:hypothetical protein
LRFQLLQKLFIGLFLVSGLLSEFFNIHFSKVSNYSV